MAHVDPIPALKQQVARKLVELLDGRSLEYGANAFGSSRWRLAELRAGKLDRFSLETLIRYVARLDQAVAITIEQRPRVWTKPERRGRNAGQSGSGASTATGSTGDRATAPSVRPSPT